MFFFRGKDKWYVYRAVDEHGQDRADRRAQAERMAPRDWRDDPADRAQSRADTGSSMHP